MFYFYAKYQIITVMVHVSNVHQDFIDNNAFGQPNLALRFHTNNISGVGF